MTTQIPRHQVTERFELELFPLDGFGRPSCPDCDEVFYEADMGHASLGDAVDWALGHDCLDGAK